MQGHGNLLYRISLLKMQGKDQALFWGKAQLYTFYLTAELGSRQKHYDLIFRGLTQEDEVIRWILNQVFDGYDSVLLAHILSRLVDSNQLHPGQER